ncbi:Olfactory Receptor 10J1 [Manis pentadactyla]|nr:Olfactory Receptor 10J1 [Manis pentadactyla]
MQCFSNGSLKKATGAKREFGRNTSTLRGKNSSIPSWRNWQRPGMYQRRERTTQCSLVIVVPMGLVFTSYVLIISTILRITSAEGRKKAFATCASHLTVVIVHYGCASIAYLKPRSENSRDQDQLISVTYTVITPLLNPVVYTLRNKEVRDALRRAIGKKPLA